MAKDDRHPKMSMKTRNMYNWSRKSNPMKVSVPGFDTIASRTIDQHRDATQVKAKFVSRSFSAENHRNLDRPTTVVCSFCQKVHRMHNSPNRPTGASWSESKMSPSQFNIVVGTSETETRLPPHQLFQEVSSTSSEYTSTPPQCNPISMNALIHADMRPSTCVYGRVQFIEVSGQPSKYVPPATINPPNRADSIDDHSDSQPSLCPTCVSTNAMGQEPRFPELMTDSQYDRVMRKRPRIVWLQLAIDRFVDCSPGFRHQGDRVHRNYRNLCQADHSHSEVLASSPRCAKVVGGTSIFDSCPTERVMTSPATNATNDDGENHPTTPNVGVNVHDHRTIYAACHCSQSPATRRGSDRYQPKQRTEPIGFVRPNTTIQRLFQMSGRIPPTQAVLITCDSHTPSQQTDCATIIGGANQSARDFIPLYVRQAEVR